MTHGYEVLHLEGNGVLDLLMRGGTVEPDKPSRSVSRPLFGLPALLYRCDMARSDVPRFAVHVGRANMQALRKSVIETIRAMRINS